MLEMLGKLEEKERVKISKALQKRLFASDLWREAKTVGLYLSMTNEWDTYQIVEQAFKEGKNIAIPKTIDETRALIFYQIEDLTQTVIGNFGISEPDTQKAKEIDKNQIDLLLVPGLIFTRDGYRIGFGGGYYDRFLTDFVQPTVSLASTKQLVDDFPVEPFDIPVNYLLTEEGFVK